MRTVKGWEISVALIEIEPQLIKVSIRSQDINVFDVSQLAVALGGGGHKGAAGAVLKMSLGDAKKLIVTKAKELYKL
jgi:phosphoesterase RecJ-like protein